MLQQDYLISSYAKFNDEKTIMITGGAGFLGHHVVEHFLKNTNWKIIILDSLTYAGDMSKIFDLNNNKDKLVKDIEVFDPKRVKFFWHDLRAPISNTLDTQLGKIDYIIHLAAETHVDRSLQDSIPFVMSNVIGTTNLLEYLKNYQPHCKTLIFSTDEVFGPALEGEYFKEDDPHRPSNPYAASKSGEEMIAFSFAHAFGLPISIVRSMNIIGERQHVEKFVPKTIKALLKGEKITLHGRNKKDISSRCWIHARNVADSLLFLLEKAKPKEFYHVIGEEKDVFEIANWISEIINKRKLLDEEIEFVDYHHARPGHDKRYALSDEKMSKLGWIPPINLEQSLKKTVKWELENKK